jgi:hypothetical protein
MIFVMFLICANICNKNLFNQHWPDIFQFIGATCSFIDLLIC